MNRLFSKHSVWGLITISTFVLGKQWAGTSGSSEGLVEGQVKREGSESRGTLQDSSLDPQKRVRLRSSRDSRKAEKQEGRLPGDGRLSQEEIDLWVNESTRSRSPIERRRALDRILQKIRSSEVSFEDALAFRQALQEQGAKEEGKLLDYALGAYQPDEALAHLETLPPEERVDFLEDIIPGLASENPAEAINLFESLTSEEQAKVRPEFLEGLVDHDTAVATDYLYDSSDLENYHWRPMAELTRELVKDKGLQPTLDWANELPQGAQRRDAWSSAYAVWASKDPIAAGESINALPDGVDRNLAINGFVSAHVHRDGPLAMDWAHSISNPGLREAAMIRIGKQFYQKDPDAAAGWYSSSGWSPSSWAKVTNSVER